MNKDILVLDNLGNLFIHKSKDGFIKAMYGFVDGILVGSWSDTDDIRVLKGRELKDLIEYIKREVDTNQKITPIDSDSVFEAISNYTMRSKFDLRISVIDWRSFDGEGRWLNE